MKYRNNRSGEEREFSCTVISKIWEPVEMPAPLPVVSEAPVKKPVKRKRVAKSND